MQIIREGTWHYKTEFWFTEFFDLLSDRIIKLFHYSLKSNNSFHSVGFSVEL